MAAVSSLESATNLAPRDPSRKKEGKLAHFTRYPWNARQVARAHAHIAADRRLSPSHVRMLSAAAINACPEGWFWQQLGGELGAQLGIDLDRTRRTVTPETRKRGARPRVAHPKCGADRSIHGVKAGQRDRRQLQKWGYLDWFSVGPGECYPRRDEDGKVHFGGGLKTSTGGVVYRLNWRQLGSPASKTCDQWLITRRVISGRSHASLIRSPSEIAPNLKDPAVVPPATPPPPAPPPAPPERPATADEVRAMLAAKLPGWTESPREIAAPAAPKGASETPAASPGAAPPAPESRGTKESKPEAGELAALVLRAAAIERAHCTRRDPRAATPAPIGALLGVAAPPARRSVEDGREVDPDPDRTS